MRQRNDKDTSKQSTPKVNKDNLTKKKSILQKKMLFKYTVVLPPYSSFSILSYRITPDSTLNGYNSTGWQGTSNCTLKRCRVTLSIANNDNNAIVMGKAVNALMKVIYVIEGDTKKFKISPRKS